MTATVDRSSSRMDPITVVVALTGTAVLASRSALVAVTGHTVVTLTLLFVALLLLALLAPASGAAGASRPRVPARAVLVLGIGVFAIARVAAGGHAPSSLSTTVVATNVLAAVAEEAWFRRFWFALLEPAGPVLAIGGTAVLFALVHVGSYGVWVVPVDLAAGALLGWQRHMTGSWAPSAWTHAIANLFVLL